MKRVFSILLLSAATWSFAQISFSAKANLLFPTGSPSWKNIKNTVVDSYESKGKNNVGFNFGLSAQVSLPMNWFLMPELYYTTFTNEFTEPITNTTLKAKSNRVDLPILIGKSFLGNMLGLYVGPVASYNLSKDNQWQDFRENATKDFTVGYQLGAQAKIKKLIVNARYEGAFSKDTRNFINNNITETVTYDNRPSLFMLGLGYEF